MKPTVQARNLATGQLVDLDQLPNAIVFRFDGGDLATGKHRVTCVLIVAAGRRTSVHLDNGCRVQVRSDRQFVVVDRDLPSDTEAKRDGGRFHPGQPVRYLKRGEVRTATVTHVRPGRTPDHVTVLRVELQTGDRVQHLDILADQVITGLHPTDAQWDRFGAGLTSADMDRLDRSPE